MLKMRMRMKSKPQPTEEIEDEKEEQRQEETEIVKEPVEETPKKEENKEKQQESEEKGKSEERKVTQRQTHSEKKQDEINTLNQEETTHSKAEVTHRQAKHPRRQVAQDVKFKKNRKKTANLQPSPAQVKLFENYFVGKERESPSARGLKQTRQGSTVERSGDNPIPRGLTQDKLTSKTNPRRNPGGNISTITCKTFVHTIP